MKLPMLGGIMGKTLATRGQSFFQFKGDISVAADFPTSEEVQLGWTYHIVNDVIDNDPTKTNTGQSFTADDEIYWNGAGWTIIGSKVSLSYHQDITIESDGQTSFTLGATLLTPANSILVLRSTVRKYGASFDYTISGNTLTWKNPGSPALTLKAGENFAIWGDVPLTGSPIVALFAAYSNIARTDETGDGSLWTMLYEVEDFDVGGNYNTTTSRFTAPFDGAYLFLGAASLGQVNSGHTFGQLKLKTTTENIAIDELNVGAIRTSSNTALLSGCKITKMNAGHTAQMDLIVSGGTKTIAIPTLKSSFSGFLIERF